MQCYLALFTWNSSLAVVIKHHFMRRQAHLVSFINPLRLCWSKDGNLCSEAISGELTLALCYGCLASLFHIVYGRATCVSGLLSPVMDQDHAALQGILWGKLKVGLHLQQNEELFLPVDLWFFNLSEQANQVLLP